MADKLLDLVAVNRAIASTLDYDEVLDLVVEKAAELTGAETCVLLLAGPDGIGRVAASRGVDAPEVARFAAPLNERIGRALMELLGVGAEERVLSLPIISRERVRGLLALYRSAAPLDADEEFLVDALADQAAIALSHARRYGELRRASEKKSRLLEAIQSNTATHLAYLDRDLRFREANSALCRALGRSSEELAGRPYSEVVPEEESARLLAEARATGRAREARELHRWPEGPGGESLYWDWSARPILDRAGAVEGIVVTVIDVTEKVRARAELEEADRRKNEFLAMLAHELRNPLAAIKGAVDILRLRVSDDPELAGVRDAAGRQIEHMTRLLDDLLDVSRIARGRLDLEWEPLDLTEAARQAIHAVEPAIRSSHQELSVSLPSSPLPVRGDFHRLVQVLSNLLSNASRYSRPGGHISLRASALDGEIEVRVSDDGVGIPPDVLPRVFDLFVQSPSDDRGRSGLGLGLTIVKRMVELHGGQVEAHSGGEDRGSEFVVTLPACPRGGAERAPRKERAKAPAPARRILLVEDNRTVADMLEALLEMDGHTILRAGEGESALRIAEEEEPDVVLLDIGLPGMSGYEVARRLRQTIAPPEPLVIAMSGYSGEERRAAEAGIDHYLVKPVDADDLRELLS